VDETPVEGGREAAAALDELVTLMATDFLSDWRGMSLTTVATLGRLERQGPIRLTALAAVEGVTQPTMTVLVQRLEVQGLVSRVSDPDDGRVRLVAITDAGRELLDGRRRAREERLAGWLSALPGQDVRALEETLGTALPIVRRMIDAARARDLAD
jgi:DNA-binding MarR family transcriptional regulator